MVGDPFKGGVVGGVERSGNDYRATSIDSASGAVNGDIPYDDTLGSMAKTLGLALGIPSAQLDEAVKVGKPVLSAFA